MRKFFQDLNQEYLETRSSVGEDWLEWIIQRKMTWGMRWGGRDSHVCLAAFNL
ncbi:hypothetical protein [Streptococcus suis]|uniref:hypothetical protein n=1 Tax=Streptococcus suis TaxID=1307 RepID=UPI00390889F6